MKILSENQIKDIQVGAVKEYMESGGNDRPYHWYDTPKGKFTEDNYTSLVKEIFQVNPVVFICIYRLSNDLGSLPLSLVKDKGKDQEIIKAEDKRSSQLFHLLDNPHPGASWIDFVAEWNMYLTLSGNSYTHAIRVGNQRKIQELWNLFPDYVTFKLAKDKRTVENYFYKVPNQRKIAVPPEDIMHLKTVSPLGTYMGMSLLSPARYSADSHTAAMKHNVATLQNGAVVGGIVNVKGEGVDTEYLKKLKERGRETLEGPENAGRILYTGGEGEVSFTEMGMTHRDINWTDGLHLSADLICMTLGMPPEIIGREAKYKNFETALRIYFTGTVIPRAKKLLFGLNNWIVKPMLGDDYRLIVNLNEIEALKQDKNELYKSLSEAVRSAWMSPEEARREAGLPDSKDPELSEHYISSTMTQVSNIAQIPSKVGPND